MTRHLLALAILAISGTCFGYQDTLLDTLVEHEITVAKDFVEAGGDVPLIIGLDVREEKVKGLFSRNLLLQGAQQKLADRGIPSEPYRGNLQSALLSGALSRRDLLAPKLIIEIEVNRDDSISGYSAWCLLSLVEYSRATPGSRRLVAKRSWSVRRELKGIPREDVENNLIEYVQGELADLSFSSRNDKASEVGAKRGRMRMAHRARVESGDGVDGETLKYSVTRNDPGKRSLVLVGASVGTPSLVNLNATFWGSYHLPIVVGLSGMYLGKTTRGFQVDAAWAFDNVGNFKQGVGMTFIAINETRVVETPQLDSTGHDVTQIVRDTFNDLQPYLGPSYIIDWHHFRVQVGAAYKLDPANQSSIRLLIQAGYMVPIGF